MHSFLKKIIKISKFMASKSLKTLVKSIWHKWNSTKLTWHFVRQSVLFTLEICLAQFRLNCSWNLFLWIYSVLLLYRRFRVILHEWHYYSCSCQYMWLQIYPHKKVNSLLLYINCCCCAKGIWTACSLCLKKDSGDIKWSFSKRGNNCPL